MYKKLAIPAYYHLISTILSSALAVSVFENEISTFPPPPKPYAFGYAAGRYPGHIDRTHSEVSDGSGVIQGSYSYVDPKFQIHKVDYIADENGFHPILNRNIPTLPRDTPAVAAAKEKHLLQYSIIADAHQRLPQRAFAPVESNAVQYAKNKHFELFEKIAQEHAKIAAEREALKRSNEEKYDR
ncbi:adult-specific rigid cuticular protein 15.5-like [Sitophilus oryzae]|uniref:Adult-specific rigid cuticular protein 15.5-like n=1 Tax=Sitophilus oryzae TaxID=7048 RepID=A0A6J2YL24_SITOR|nr:adult-specific rigid cuticular protein 15.5-like [Sitophilus oryzae]